MYVVWKHTRHFYCKLLLLSMKYWAATSSLTFGIVYCFSFPFFTIHSSFYVRDRRLSTVNREITCRYMILFMLHRKLQHCLQYHTLGNSSSIIVLEIFWKKQLKVLNACSYSFFCFCTINIFVYTKIAKNN